MVNDQPTPQPTSTEALLKRVGRRLSTRSSCGCGGEYAGHDSCRDRDLIADLGTALLAAEQREQKGERVFQAVVYAFEGREIPDDLRDHGMVRRALKYREQAESAAAALRAERDALRDNRKGIIYLAPVAK